MDREDDRDRLSEPVDGDGRVLSVHFGRSANCSSMGSVVDVLFVSSVLGTALLGALAVMLKDRRPDPPPATDAKAETPEEKDAP